MRRALEWLLSGFLQGLVWLYRLTLGPLLGPRCRFLPTCSDYALDALKSHGPWRGSLLAGRRILRCHPWGSSGYDPVPEQAGPKRADDEKSEEKVM